MKKILSALALSVISAMANANEATYEFSGTFNAPSRLVLEGDDGPAPLFLGLVNAGDKFSGSFTYDSSAVSATFSSSDYRGVIYTLKNFRFTASNSFNAAASWNNAVVGVRHHVGPNGDPRDEMSITASGNILGHTLNASATVYVPENTFSNLTIPGNFNQFSDGSLSASMIHDDGWGGYMMDTATGSMEVHLSPVSPVPEPSSAAMMLAALASIGGVAALRRRQG